MKPVVDLSDDALADMVDRSRYQGEAALERAAIAHWRKVNDLAPEWLKDKREWKHLSKAEHDHHKEIARAVIEAA